MPNIPSYPEVVYHAGKPWNRRPRGWFLQRRRADVCGEGQGRSGPLNSARTIFTIKPLITEKCPFANLPESGSGRWGQGLNVAKMKECIWVKPKLVANFEFLEWTDTNHILTYQVR